MSVDIYTDASHGADGWTGAYIIGRGNSPVGVYLECANSSVSAEMWTAITAIEAAQGQGWDYHDMLVHIDIIHIHSVIKKGRVEPARLLAEFVAGGVGIMTDGRQHPDYRRCHHHARVIAGLHGSKHPVLLKKKPKQPKVKKPPRPEVQRMLDAIEESLDNHPEGVTEIRIAQETGLGLNAVHKLLRRFESASEARCEKPSDPVAACDLSRWKWRRGPSSPLGMMMEKAGYKVLT